MAGGASLDPVLDLDDSPSLLLKCGFSIGLSPGRFLDGEEVDSAALRLTPRASSGVLLSSVMASFKAEVLV